jgi:hypothetical protein
MQDNEKTLTKCILFVKFLFKKYLEREVFIGSELSFHSNEIFKEIKTFEQKEYEFKTCEERKNLVCKKILLRNKKDKKLSEFDLIHVKKIVNEHILDINFIQSYFEKYGVYNRIAVCYSGHVRSFEKNYKNLYNFFFKNINPDFFIHAWADYGFKKNSDYKDLNTVWFKEDNLSINKENLISLLNPKKIIVENFSSKKDYFEFSKEKEMFYFLGQAKDNASKYINSQLYSINNSNFLKKIFEDENNFSYDLVIRMRFDLNLHKNVDLENLSDILYNIRKNEKIIYIANPINSHHGHPGGGGGCLKCIEQFSNLSFEKHVHVNDICDVIAISSSSNMDFYSDLYNHSKNIYNDNSVNNFYNIEQLKIEYVKVDNMYFICQFGDAIEKHCFCYYPEKLLRKYLEDFILLNESCFFGSVS